MCSWNYGKYKFPTWKLHVKAPSTRNLKHVKAFKLTLCNGSIVEVQVLCAMENILLMRTKRHTALRYNGSSALRFL